MPEIETQSDRATIIQRIKRNSGLVAGGSLAAVVFGVAALALNARALGVSGLGTLALITTLGALIQQIIAFQTWVPLVKMGTDSLESGDRRRVGELTIVSITFDMLAAMAATGLAILIVLLAGDYLGISPLYRGAAALYMATLITGLSDTPNGLLRLFNRFEIVTAIQFARAALGAVLAATLFILGASLATYIYSYAVLAAGSNIVLILCGFRITQQAGIPFSTRNFGTIWRAESRQFWSFSWVLSLSGTIYVIREQAPLLLIGALLGPSAVGIYHVASRIALLLGMASTAINQVTYPEIARLAAAGRTEGLNWLVARIGMGGGALGLVALITVIVLGQPLLLIFGGPSYSGAYWPLIILFAASGLSLAGVGMRNAVVVLAGPMELLIANFIAFLGFAFAIFWGTVAFGIIGTSGAQIAFEVLAISIILKKYTSLSNSKEENAASR